MATITGSGDLKVQPATTQGDGGAREGTGDVRAQPATVDGLPDASTLLRDACEYAHAADVLAGVGDCNFPRVPMFLLGRAFELALKAYLLVTGTPPDDLRRREMGHDLAKRLAVAKQRDYCATRVRKSSSRASPAGTSESCGSTPRSTDWCFRNLSCCEPHWTKLSAPSPNMFGAAPSTALRSQRS